MIILDVPFQNFLVNKFSNKNFVTSDSNVVYHSLRRTLIRSVQYSTLINKSYNWIARDKNYKLWTSMVVINEWDEYYFRKKVFLVKKKLLF